ncbi:MAG: vanadium-dependent haloperoxidase [Saprospiraceae bacterium]
MPGAKKVILLLLTGSVFFICCSSDHKSSLLAGKTSAETELLGKNNYAYRWAELALKATGNDTERFKPRPTITSRYLGLVFVTIFDAWSRYDDHAIPVYLENVDRRPSAEQTTKNKEIAISYAAFRALNEYYFSDTLMFRRFMTELGLDPDNNSLDPNTPEGIGNLAAKAVVLARRNDGSNQYGDEKGSDGTPFNDYTKYKPVNDPDKNIEINRWQPKYFADGQGGKVCPSCLTPFWQKVKPVALKSADQFRSPPPPTVGSEQMATEVKDVVDMQANLTNEQKALVEFMRDGPSSVQQAGHWLRFAQNVSVRDNHTLDQDVKLYFLTEVTAMDAFIACWDTKMIYDNARPYALVHYYFKDKMIKGWGGPDKGIISMKGQDWRPYSPETFICPPFPAYVSGHSTVSGGCSEILKLFTGDDHFGEEVKRMPGVLTGEHIVCDSVTLKFPTFTETAELAGISRVLGGYHIQVDNLEGLKLGRKVGREVWGWYLEHVK